MRAEGEEMEARGKYWRGMGVCLNKRPIFLEDPRAKE
jgi:hypothetical protein